MDNISRSDPPSRPFSNLQRTEFTKRLQQQHFDIVVVGGGITGAGIALDAASRGMRVALVEKGDFASGTSSKSTKLIHGGLRYLKQFDLSLVREAGTERAIIHKLAPHLVIPEKMLLPVLRNGSYSRWSLSIGLGFYDILARVDSKDRRQMLDKDTALKREPLLRSNDLMGAGYYAEYRTDDARLTIENIKTAVYYGATAINYTKVVSFHYADNDVCGVNVADGVSGERYDISSHYVINATGPWVDEINRLGNESGSDRLCLSKGVHLVLSRHRLPLRQSVYFDIADGRMMFAIPRGETSYIGTTDTPYSGNRDAIGVDEGDAKYLLNAVNHMFPSVRLRLDDVVSSWAGVRPLIREQGKSVSELSRKDEIFISASGLITIAGGKLTGYRKMAERAVDLIFKQMVKSSTTRLINKELRESRTASISLCGGEFGDRREVEEYTDEISLRIQKRGLGRRDAEHLVNHYGRQAEAILSSWEEITAQSRVQASAEKRTPVRDLVRAEYRFSAWHEMIQTPMDFFARRSGRLYFDVDNMEDLIEPVLSEHQTLFMESAESIEDYRHALYTDIRTRRDFTESRE